MATVHLQDVPIDIAIDLLPKLGKLAASGSLIVLSH